MSRALVTGLHPDDPDLVAHMQQVCDTIPFVGAIGLQVLGYDAHTGWCDTALTPHSDWAAHHHAGRVANSLLVALLDQVGSLPAIMQPGAVKVMSTLNMSLNFGTPVALGADASLMRLRGRCSMHTGDVLTCELAVHDSKRALAGCGTCAFLRGALPGGRPEDYAPAGGEGAMPANRPVVPRRHLGLASFAEWLGMHPTGSNAAASTAPFGHHLVGATEPRPVFHGGASAALALEQATQYAVSLGYGRLVHSHIDYLRAGLAEDMVQRARVVRQTRRTLAVQVETTQQQGQRVVTVSQHRFVRG